MQFQADVLGVPVIRPKVRTRPSARPTRPGWRSGSGARLTTCGPTGPATASGSRRSIRRGGRRVWALEEGRHEDLRLGRVSGPEATPAAVAAPAPEPSRPHRRAARSDHRRRRNGRCAGPRPDPARPAVTLVERARSRPGQPVDTMAAPQRRALRRDRSRIGRRMHHREQDPAADLPRSFEETTGSTSP